MEELLLKDPQLVAQQAAIREPEAKWLKDRIRDIPAREVDNKVATIAARVMAAIDCTTCANCCKTLEPEISEEELQRLRSRSEDREQFMAKFVGFDAVRGVHFLKPVCTFLTDHTCSVYGDRPSSCREYPRLVPDLKFRWKKTMEDYAVCPIVFNTIEQLKADLRDSENIPHGDPRGG